MANSVPVLFDDLLCSSYYRISSYDTVTNCDSSVTSMLVVNAVFASQHSPTMTTVSPFARSSAFDEPRISGREQTVSPPYSHHPISAA